MALFRKRPLALACLIFAFGIAGSFFIPLIYCGIVAVAAGILFLAFLLLSCFRGYKYWLLCAVLLSLFVAIAFLRVGLYRQNEPQLQQKIGSSVTATLTVKEVRYNSAYSAELLVEISELDGKAVAATALLSLDYTSPFYKGDQLLGEFLCAPLTYDNYYATQPYHYMAEGCHIMLVGSADTPPALLKSGEKTALSSLAALRLYLSKRLTNAVKGEAGSLMSAMLLGTRSLLPNAVTRDFSRAGVSHLLALSGLHIGILALLLELLLSLFAIPKKARVLITLALLCLYLVITGGAVSTVRAVFMFSTVYLAFFSQRGADAVTALLVAAAAILLLSPYAIFSVSFQMTVLATLGILAYGTLSKVFLRLPRGKGGVRTFLYRGLVYVLSSLAVSLAAGFAVLPVQLYAFGTLSALTPLANLLILPLATPFLCLGLATLLLFPCNLFAMAAGALGRFILWISAALASVDGVFSLQYAFVPYLVWPLVLLTVLLLVLDLKKHRYLAALPILLFLVLFAGGILITNGVHQGEIQVAYRVSGKQEGIVCTKEGKSLLIDLSGGSYTQLNEDWQLAAAACATEIDVLCLTHYHTAQAAAFDRLASRIKVGQLWVPRPTTIEEAEILSRLKESADRNRVVVVLYDYQAPLTVFEDATLTISAPLYSARSTEPAFCLTLFGATKSVYYETAAYSEYCALHDVTREAREASLYIVGAHGPVPHQEIIPNVTGSSTVILPNDTVITHFLPQETHTYIVAPKTYVTVLQ